MLAEFCGRTVQLILYSICNDIFWARVSKKSQQLVGCPLNDDRASFATEKRRSNCACRQQVMQRSSSSEPRTRIAHGNRVLVMAEHKPK
jgi:hypothetical protein